MSINKHGLKMNGLKKASGETGGWAHGSGGYDEVFYDVNTGEIWTVPQVSIGQNWWTQYHDKDIVKVCNAVSHLTMQELADMIAEAVKRHKCVQW